MLYKQRRLKNRRGDMEGQKRGDLDKIFLCKEHWEMDVLAHEKTRGSPQCTV
jgi:hypothetical protein